jgi:hypothetical protein
MREGDPESLADRIAPTRPAARQLPTEREGDSVMNRSSEQDKQTIGVTFGKIFLAMFLMALAIAISESAGF